MVLLYSAVVHKDYPVGVSRNIFVVSDHDDGVAFAVETDEELHDLTGGDAVEVSGRLVGEQDRRLVHEGAGDGDPLALAAGELVRPVPGPVSQADELQHLPGAFEPPFGWNPGVDQGKLHILEGA